MAKIKNWEVVSKSAKLMHWVNWQPVRNGLLNPTQILVNQSRDGRWKALFNGGSSFNSFRRAEDTKAEMIKYVNWYMKQNPEG